jgi:hypothetical protein
VPARCGAAKVFLRGEIKRSVKLQGLGVTKGARAAIEAAGGSTDAPLPQPKPKREPKPVPPQALADAKPAKERKEPKEQAGEAKEAKVKREGAKPAPEGKKGGKA